jgi:hypothetical protein
MIMLGNRTINRLRVEYFSHCCNEEKCQLSTRCHCRRYSYSREKEQGKQERDSDRYQARGRDVEREREREREGENKWGKEQGKSTIYIDYQSTNGVSTSLHIHRDRSDKFRRIEYR